MYALFAQLLNLVRQIHILLSNRSFRTFSRSFYNAAVIPLGGAITPLMKNDLANLIYSLALHVQLHDEMAVAYG